MAKKNNNIIVRSEYGNFVDYDAIGKFEFFLNKVSERTDKAFGLRDKYECDDEALGADVEYFGFNILQDDRMRYIIENIVTLPDSQLSKASNTNHLDGPPFS